MAAAGPVRRVIGMHCHDHPAGHRRIGDDERERASTELRALYRDGLIDRDELIDRLDRVWEAARARDLRRAVGPDRVTIRTARAARPR